MAYALRGYLAQSSMAMAMAEIKCQFRPVTARNWLEIAGWFELEEWLRRALMPLPTSAGMLYRYVALQYVMTQ